RHCNYLLSLHDALPILSRMNDQSASVLQFLKGQEICQIAFGMYDLQINWGNGGLSCTGRVIYTPSAGGEVVWTEGHPFDAVPVLDRKSTGLNSSHQISS